MTSTFPTSRTSSQSLKNGLREIQHKKEALMKLEIALKNRINEFRELCLKEGELTGHLPVDYPLQPREPIPQVRRRMTRSNGNIPNELIVTNSILQTALRSQSSRLTPSSTSSTISTGEDSLKMRLQSVEEPAARFRTSKSATIEEPPKVAELNGGTKFPHYYEETKPFQMSDFYKYSSKLRQTTTIQDTTTKNNNDNNQNYQINSQQPPTRPPRLNSHLATQQHLGQRAQIEQTPLHQYSTNCELAKQFNNNGPKTTRQFQEEVNRKQAHIKMASCDDQILASRTLIEKSSQKFIEATAKAIASNPSLAERLNSLLPQHNGTAAERY